MLPSRIIDIKLKSTVRIKVNINAISYRKILLHEMERWSRYDRAGVIPRGKYESNFVWYSFVCGFAFKKIDFEDLTNIPKFA